MSSTNITLEKSSIIVSHRLAQLLTELNVCEAESFHPLYKSDNAALDEFVALKRRLRREHGLVDVRHGPVDNLRGRDYDSDHSYVAKRFTKRD